MRGKYYPPFAPLQKNKRGNKKKIPLRSHRENNKIKYRVQKLSALVEKEAKQAAGKSSHTRQNKTNKARAGGGARIVPASTRRTTKKET